MLSDVCYSKFVFHIHHVHSLMQQSWAWWVGSLKKGVSGRVLSASVGETLSHPPVVFGFRPCEQLKEPRSLKSFKAEVSESGRGKKKLDKTQRRLCVLVIGSAKKGFSWKTARDWLEGEGEWGSFWRVGERCELRLQRERSLLRFAGVPHCCNATGLSLALLHSGHKEGISSFIYSISCHVDPKMAPFPLQNCPVRLCGVHPNPLPKKRDP